MEMIDNYPPGMTWEDWEYLEGKCYCDRCGAEIEGDPCECGDLIYCQECYEDMCGREENET